jgi:K+-transporting ATPase ATPase C chain
MRTLLWPSLTLLALFSLLTGILYPLVVTVAAQIAFPHQAQGSLIHAQGKTVGSELIGQPFDNPKYFWGRPSATSPTPYNGMASSGSNLGPSNPALSEAIKTRIAALKTAQPASSQNSQNPIPVDLVTSSGSGLDPHLSPAAALFQVYRVAFVRGLSEKCVRQLVEQHIKNRTFGFLGEPRINVLQLNLALDNLSKSIPHE